MMSTYVRRRLIIAAALDCMETSAQSAAARAESATAGHDSIRRETRMGVRVRTSLYRVWVHEEEYDEEEDVLDTHFTDAVMQIPGVVEYDWVDYAD
jgi:hypothetical protein